MFTGLKLTTLGIELNSYLIANNLPLIISKMKIGDGNSDTYDRTSLVNEKMEALIESVTAYENGDMVRATFTNENLANGFNVREVGIIAIDPRNNSNVLYSYDNAGSGECDYFEAGNGLVILKEVFEIVSSFGNMEIDNINLTISPQYVFITEEKYKAAVKNAGTYTKGTAYKVNDVVDYDNGKLLSTVAHTAGTTPDFEKMVWIVPRKTYDHFEMEIDSASFSNPSVECGGITYHGGCEGFTQDDWVEWLNYKPCILVEQGGIECYLNVDNYAQDKNGNVVDISTISSTARNVMVRHQRIGIASNELSNGKWIIRCTNDPNDRRYSYAAFENGMRGCKEIFFGVYNGTIANNKLHSLSGAEISANGQSVSSYRKLAQANGMQYQILDIRKFSYLRHLFILQNGTINGNISSGFDTTNTTSGGTNEFGLNNNDMSLKWGKWLGMETNCFSEYIDGSYIDSNYRLLVAKNNNFSDTGDGYEYCGRLYSLGEGYMGSSVTFSPELGFIPNNTSGTANTRFHAKTVGVVTGTSMVNYGYNIFYNHYTKAPTFTGVGITARLCYMQY